MLNGLGPSFAFSEAGGGVVAGRAEQMKEVVGFLRTAGPTLSPFNAWIFTKGLETLRLRMRAHCESAQALAARYDSNARFVTGSFLPEGYVWRPHGGDARLGTIGQGSSGYLQLGRHLDEFDLVFAFPWGGEEPIMLDLMRAYGRSDALLLLNTVDDGVRVYQGGRLLPKDPHDLPAR